MFGCDGQAKRATMIQKGEREADFWDNPVVEKDEMEEHELQAYIEAGGTSAQHDQLSSARVGSLCAVTKFCGQSLSRERALCSADAFAHGWRCVFRRARDGEGEGRRGCAARPGVQDQDRRRARGRVLLSLNVMYHALLLASSSSRLPLG